MAVEFQLHSSDLSRQGVHLQCYAGYLDIIINGKYEEVISKILQQDLNMINRWCEVKLISLNPENCYHPLEPANKIWQGSTIYLGKVNN